MRQLLDSSSGPAKSFRSELMERDEAPVRKRELIAVGIAILSLAVAIIAIVLSY